jgi:hypothetical protein
MATYITDGRLGKLLQRGRAFLALTFTGDPYRSSRTFTVAGTTRRS